MSQYSQDKLVETGLTFDVNIANKYSCVQSQLYDHINFETVFVTNSHVLICIRFSDVFTCVSSFCLKEKICVFLSILCDCNTKKCDVRRARLRSVGLATFLMNTSLLWYHCRFLDKKSCCANYLYHKSHFTN